MPEYLQRRIVDRSPFETLDVEGVGELIRIGVERAREAAVDVGLGVCGEHGGDPDSIDFFDRVGLDYVSCSPYRVPIASVAAAQAAIRHRVRTLKLRAVDDRRLVDWGAHGPILPAIAGLVIGELAGDPTSLGSRWRECGWTIASKSSSGV